MLADVAKWLGTAVLLVVLALAVNALVPALSGHIAMGVAAAILFVVLYACRSLGVDVLE